MHLSKELIHARTCYQHLAGELGVGITRRFLAEGLVTEGLVKNDMARNDFVITAKGRRWCAAHQIALHARDTAKPCLDHSHRQPHLAGELGRALLRFMLANGHCERAPGRRVSVTAGGIRFLRASLGLRWHNDCDYTGARP